MIDLIIAALFQAAAGDPAPAATEPAAQTETAPAQATESTDRPEARRRCRSQRVTGSRIAGRVCLSDAEQEMLEQEAQGAVNRLQRPPAQQFD